MRRYLINYASFWPCHTRRSQMSCVNSGVQFFRILKGRCHGNQLKSKNRRFYRPIYLSHCHSKSDCNNAIPISKRLDRMNISTSCIILVTFGSETSEFMLLTIAPFVAIRQKLAYHAKYLRMSWTFLDLLYRFGRRISGDDFPNIRLAVAQGNLFFASAFNHWLADHKSAFKRFNSKNQVTSYPNLVKFRPVISEFTLLKRAIFAAIRPQFDDDLHLSRWRFQMDWKIAISISAE